MLRPFPSPRRALSRPGGKVLIACWSAKGGSGTTVVSVALGLLVARAASVRPPGVVLVEERGRALTRADVEGVLGVPVRAVVEVDSTVARAVDAGLLAGRLPAGLERALRNAA